MHAAPRLRALAAPRRSRCRRAATRLRQPLRRHRPRRLPPPATAAIVLHERRLWSAPAGAPREVFAVERATAPASPASRSATAETRRCDTLEATRRARPHAAWRPARPGHQRRRPPHAPPTARPGLHRPEPRRRRPSSSRPRRAVSGVDWSPLDDVLVYSARGDGGHARTSSRMDRQRARTTATSPPRPTPCASGGRASTPRAAWRSTSASTATTARASIFIFQNTATQIRVTTGGAGHERPARHALRGGLRRRPRLLARRALDRLPPAHRRPATAAWATWDIMTVRTDGTEPHRDRDGRRLPRRARLGARGDRLHEIGRGRRHVAPGRDAARRLEPPAPLATQAARLRPQRPRAGCRSRARPRRTSPRGTPRSCPATAEAATVRGERQVELPGPGAVLVVAVDGGDRHLLASSSRRPGPQPMQAPQPGWITRTPVFSKTST